MQSLDCSSSWKPKGHADSFLPIHVDLPTAILAVACSNSQERLYGIVGKGSDLRVDAISRKLGIKSAIVSDIEESTHVVEYEVLRA